MKCPFLRDANVKYCEASVYRKMILKAGSDAGSERCSSPAYRACPAAVPRLSGEAARSQCPFLHEARTEFCGAAAVAKYIPATNDLLSRCNSDGHFYCELFLAHADPQGERRPHQERRAAGVAARTPRVDGMPVPENLSYAPNHMWLDVADDGICHVGLDAFAARVIAGVERISFISTSAVRRPVAVLTVNGVDMQMVFPNPVNVTAVNAYLRTAPSRVIEDPYGTGWLFEGFEPAAAGRRSGTIREGLIDGTSAGAWFRAEADRLNEFVHQRTARPDRDGAAFMADGGSVAEGLTAHLDREDLLRLVNDFFAPQRTWRTTW